LRCDPVVILCSCGDNNVLLVEMRICRSTIEAVLLKYGIFYGKTETWIESEKLYEVLYEMEV